ncbi:condensation domain-containing protein [Streptomyces sp. M19]
MDGVSWRVLLPDLAAAWEAVAEGRPPRLEPVGTSFRRWARTLVEQATSASRTTELDHWREVGAGRARCWAAVTWTRRGTPPRPPAP